ncbi:Outer membrane protein beta-barrel domain-containing protein [Polaribacter sp. KT25b]|uniref:porin family protein n=1 Tax=Polaribacter sp. KT25b TaxID=1855336 RepID=UPI00087B8130|nr:porin family protein [Polaribacter sp. KT25b]SDR67252.1 Outer membrane protein beta-barrel domain-containing protein [Polaribacter sp. KT25b]
MDKLFFSFFLLIFTANIYSQKDSLQLGDRYADDQIYAAITYAQFDSQPSGVTKSSFSYAVSTGFLKDIILNKKGSFSFALGVGYGFDFFNHDLKVSEINNSTFFDTSENISSNVFKAHNLEFPLEIRWRTSTAKRYEFWRIYTGVKFLYNISNTFQFTENETAYKYKDVSAYRKLQYGLTFSAGYTEFNAYLFYSLTPVFEKGTINGENIDTRVLKFGLIFYLL